MKTKIAESNIVFIAFIWIVYTSIALSTFIQIIKSENFQRFVVRDARHVENRLMQ